MTCNWAIISKTCKSYVYDLYHMMLYGKRFLNFAVIFPPESKFLKHICVFPLLQAPGAIPSPHSGPLNACHLSSYTWHFNLSRTLRPAYIEENVYLEKV